MAKAVQTLTGIFHRELEADKSATTLSNFTAKAIGDAESYTDATVRNLAKKYQNVITVYVKVTLVPTDGDLEISALSGPASDSIETIESEIYIIPKGSSANTIVRCDFTIPGEYYALKIANKSATPADDATIAWAKVYEP